MNRKPPARWLLVCLLILYLPQALAALEVRTMSPSVVLVLNLVSKNRVQPVTGIVMNDDGLVLVPAEFVSSKGEIIVLDGGTDIIKNGRAAIIVDQSPVNGWALLSVEGLNRPGITLSEIMPSTDSELHLTAFPPAEYIANGLPPLWAAVKLELDESETTYSISAQTPQPYVTGAILDDCGYLAGISLTSGLQSLQPGKSPVTIFSENLKDTLKSLQIKAPEATCTRSLQKHAAQPIHEISTDRGVAEPADNRTGSNLVRPEVYSPFIKQKRLNPFQGASPKPRMTEKPSIWSQIPIWLPLLGFIMLSALTWKAYFFFRLHKNKRSLSGGDVLEQKNLGADSLYTTDRPRSAPIDHDVIPDMNALPSSCNGVLVVDGFIDRNTRFKRYCTVNTQNIDLSIGSIDTDIKIQHPGVSGSHARFVKNGEFMTLSDLGSDTGTYIKAVPCLEGEIMYFDSEDEVFLGDVQLRFSIIRKDTAQP